MVVSSTDSTFLSMSVACVGDLVSYLILLFCSILVVEYGSNASRACMENIDPPACQAPPEAPLEDVYKDYEQRLKKPKQ